MKSEIAKIGDEIVEILRKADAVRAIRMKVLAYDSNLDLNHFYRTNSLNQCGAPQHNPYLPSPVSLQGLYGFPI